MIFIAVKFSIRPECSAQWSDLVEHFTRATREEPGNIFFEWSRSVDDPDQYVLLEAFASPEAGQAHVGAAHFKTAMEGMAEVISKTPDIIHADIPNTGWSAMAELSPRT